MSHNNNNTHYQSRVWSRTSSSTEYHLVLPTHIVRPEDYLEEIESIYSAGPYDRVYLHLCTGGGSLWAACQLQSALYACEAETIAVIEGPCHSAGSILALSCDDMVISKAAYMLIHNYSGGEFGKGKELVESVIATDAWIDKLFKDTYENFLTPKEIEAVRGDHDIHLFSDEIIKRWERTLEARKQKEEEARVNVLNDVIEQAKNL